jgi:hypothetical protein
LEGVFSAFFPQKSIMPTRFGKLLEMLNTKENHR